MVLRNLLLLMMVLGLCGLAFAQSPTYGLGKTPTAETIRAWDIAIGPDGKELPEGKGSAKEGAPLYALRKFLSVAHLWFGEDSNRRNNPRLGYRYRSRRKGTPGGQGER